jgi:hypothetical protein
MSRVRQILEGLGFERRRTSARGRRSYFYARVPPTGRAPVSLCPTEPEQLSPKRPSPKNKQPLVAKDGMVSGSVELVAKAHGDRIGYGWFKSLDGETYTKVRETIQASTVVTGLTPGVLYYFQLRVTTIDGPGWISDVVSLIVR